MSKLEILKMKFVVVLFGLVCALANGAPNVQKVDSPHPAFAKDIEIIPSTDTRIISGQNAERDQFPYQVSVQWGFILSASHICGGSVVSESVVLTAAHCIYNFGTFTLVAGILNRGESTSSTQSRTASSVVSHPNWPGGSNPAAGDIALFKLSSPFTLTTSVQAVQLPSQGYVSDSGASVVSGWGRTSNTDSTLPTTLQYVNKELITVSQCAEDLISVLGTSGVLDETQICTSGQQYLAVCSGDSGGPLVQNGIQVGVVSWGVSPCGISIAPSVFTRVSTYTNWIYANL